MKQRLITLALSASLASPLMAQDPYYPTYDYSTNPGYYRETNQPQLNFNPGNMTTLPVNPVRNMFSPSNRYYESYPSGRYAPPVYGYPAYPAYQPPYPSYGQPPLSTGYSSPSQPSIPAPANDRAPAAAMERRPMHFEPNQGTVYRFRPLNEPAIPAPPPVERTQPMTERQRVPDHAGSEPWAPLGYPRMETPPPAPEAQLENSPLPVDPGMRFRPLDKPGYSSELGE